MLAFALVLSASAASSTASILKCGPLEDAFGSMVEIPVSFSPTLFALSRFEPEYLWGLGIDPGGEIWIQESDRGLDIQFGYTGEPSEVPALLEALSPVLWPEGQVLGDAEGWTVAAPWAQWEIRLSDGSLRLSEPRSAAVSIAMPQYAASLPAHGGCTLAVESLQPSIDVEAIHGKPLAIHHPFGGQQALIRFSAEVSPETLQGEGHQPVSVSGPERLMVATAGLSPLRLLSMEAVPEEIRLPADRVASLEEKLRIPAGSVLVLYSLPSGQSLSLAAAVPIETLRGRKMPGLRLWWGMRRAFRDYDSKKAGRRTLLVHYGSQDLRIRAEKGMLFLETSSELALTASDAPGLAPGQLAVASEWPLSMTLTVARNWTMFLGPIKELNFGLRATEGAWEVLLDPVALRGSCCLKNILNTALSGEEASPSGQKSVGDVQRLLLQVAVRERLAESPVLWAQGEAAPEGFAWVQPSAGGGTELEPTFVDGSFWVESHETGFIVHARHQNGEAEEIWSRDGDGNVAVQTSP
jgi:hypothetical protein